MNVRRIQAAELPGLLCLYAIENVVTDPAFRKKGYATQVLRYALEEAWKEGCYKVMLQTGSKREETLRFYEKAGFKRGVKTGFVAHPGKQHEQLV